MLFRSTYSATAANIHPHYTGADVGFSSTALPFEFFVATATTEIYTLHLTDVLPIYRMPSSSAYFPPKAM